LSESSKPGLHSFLYRFTMFLFPRSVAGSFIVDGFPKFERAGVNASDLLVNGVPATNVVEVSPDDYIFRFPDARAGVVTFEWAAGHGLRRSAAPLPMRLRTRRSISRIAAGLWMAMDGNRANWSPRPAQ
jgi:hypothetical protein